MLGDLRDEVTGEKIHGLIKSQMHLRNQIYHVATPMFRLGIIFPGPIRILSKKGKEINSSHQTSIEITREPKKGKTPRWTSMFERIKKLTPHLSIFEI